MHSEDISNNDIEGLEELSHKVDIHCKAKERIFQWLYKEQSASLRLVNNIRVCARSAKNRPRTDELQANYLLQNLYKNTI